MRLKSIICGFFMVPIAAASAGFDATVRVIHASPDAPAVDVLVNGALVPALANFSFRQAVGPVAVPAGSYDIDVVPTGGMPPGVINVDGLVLSGGVDYTVAAINTLDSIQPLVLVDDNTIDPNNARVRFVHASPNAPAVDIALAGGAVLFSSVTFGSAASEGYLTLPEGTYDLEVRLAGTGTVVLPLPGVTIDSGTVYSVFAVGLVGNTQTPLDAQIYVDAIPAPGAMSLLAVAGLVAARRRRVA